MALIVFLKGVNVGGHRTFRPSVVAQQLRRFDVVNIGAAGTFVVRRPVGRQTLRAELARRLPFACDVIICDGGEIRRLASGDPFAQAPVRRDVVQFVSVLAKRRRAPVDVPFDLPSGGEWCVRVQALQGRFVMGVYRREMRAIRVLGQLEQLFGVPVTTRSWSSILAIARELSPGRPEGLS